MRWFHSHVPLPFAAVQLPAAKNPLTEFLHFLVSHPRSSSRDVKEPEE